ncbi:NAD(+) diphosphatase [Cryobacterium sp. HLT2-28]|uniref:NAD(+) diphosphatase n=1 Tax=Cryobacterium sp. HLT2-28 TaxID=1259146 RepID=UPI00106A61FA|nr:NAD(+) diphosphatase [Cryobacterium sp. HLT2-28]TFB94740.1 NAD(+) diphosphatase [Cryobacterium sp. HLT2-28]
MSFSFTARLPLSRHAVDRDHETRSRPGLFDELWADAGTRVLVLWRGSVLLAPAAGSADAPRILLLEPQTVPEPTVRVYLGRSLAEDAAEPVGTRLVAAVLGDEAAHALEPRPEAWASLRTLATELSDRDAGLFTEALGLANWHVSHPHCPRCGAATTVESAGWSRLCPVDGGQVFPRTDPAVIVLITDADDRILLGSNALWENNRYSLLAGFVEPGESLEAAVIREMFEESGLRVTDPVYLGSQPWPFPASIMFGFTARLADGQSPGGLLPDGEEILDLRWFSRDELRASGASIILPGRSSIARAIIEAWLGEPIDFGPDQVHGWR